MDKEKILQEKYIEAIESDKVNRKKLLPGDKIYILNDFWTVDGPFTVKSTTRQGSTPSWIELTPEDNKERGSDKKIPAHTVSCTKKNAHIRAARRAMRKFKFFERLVRENLENAGLMFKW